MQRAPPCRQCSAHCFTAGLDKKLPLPLQRIHEKPSNFPQSMMLCSVTNENNPQSYCDADTVIDFPPRSTQEKHYPFQGPARPGRLSPAERDPVGQTDFSHTADSGDSDI